jgi:hypothetical protein
MYVVLQHMPNLHNIKGVTYRMWEGETGDVVMQ